MFTKFSELAKLDIRTGKSGKRPIRPPSRQAAFWDIDNEILYLATEDMQWAALSSLGGEFTSTVTDDVDNMDFSGATVIRMNNASDVTITGLLSGYTGQVVTIVSIGAGDVYLAHEDEGSSAANRLNTYGFITNASIPLAAGKGTASLIYDGVSERWRLVAHNQGAYIDYSTTWTGESSNPSLEDGTLESSYFVSGSEVDYRIALTCGANTTFGSGAWQFTTPFEISTNLLFTGLAKDTDNGTGYICMCEFLSSTEFQIYPHGDSPVDETTPFEWAEGDTLILAGKAVS